jgi:hypothetical protein
MGWWRSENGSIGDWPADIMDKALKDIEDVYLHQCGRLPTQGEIANLIEFCSCGTLKPACGDPRYPFTKASLADDETPRASPRGNQGISGPASMDVVKAGQMVNVDPTTGECFSVKDAEKVLEQQFKEMQDRGMGE